MEDLVDPVGKEAWTALREIERLRLRVEELETQLQEERRLRESTKSLPTPTQSLASTTIAPSSTSLSSQQTASDVSTKSASPLRESKNTHWEGIYTATARSEQTSYYGPSSAFYFIGRIGSHLSKYIQHYCTDNCMQPRGVNKTLVSPVTPTETDTTFARRGDVPQPSMSRTQEEYFLGLFWESHHCNVPIIAEDVFRKHYDSLWQTSRPSRKPSALVDIILAIAMQYGWAFLLQDSFTPANQKAQYDDASIAGRWYYRRCQNLLASELESPSITTLQCHIFSVIYLCCGSFQNMAHTTLAVAIRTAEILGLHLEPPEAMSRSEKELRKRLWALVYTIEAKTCMKLGRPFSVQQSDITVSPPSDGLEAASFFGSSLEAYDNEVTWLTYSSQVGKFINLSVDLYHQLHNKFDEVLGHRKHGTCYQDSQGLETVARFLTTITPSVRTWIEQVPDGIKLKRRGGGEALSIDRSPALMETAAPIWLQRHRICLELIYHTMCSNLYRPFINFTPSTGAYTPTADRHAVACVNHAIAHTHIMHQVLKETDHMNGWQEFFLWQWNATVSIVGFVFAYPIHASTANARKAIEKSIEVFEVYGSNYAIAASAATITRDLTKKADMLSCRLRNGITASACTVNTEVPPTASGGGIPSGLPENGDGFGSVVAPQDGIGTEAGLSEFMDWALTVDSFNSFEDLFADTTMGADWWGVSL
ncbi:Fc.00g093060.m01.CDS01 [Cosmosporella sp. VM-42]